MLRWDSSRITFVKYVTVAGKEACFPESVCSINCCGRFQVSFPNQSSNLIVCDNSVWMVLQLLTLQKTHIPASFNMYLVINKCVTAVKVSNFSGHYLRNRSTLDIGGLGYIGIVQHKEHSPEVLSIPPGTPCITVAFMQVHVTYNCHQWTSLCWRQRDPSLTIKGDNSAYFMLNDIEARLFVVT